MSAEELVLGIRTDMLVCPESRTPLELVPRAEAERRIPGGRPLTSPNARGYQPVGPTPQVLLRKDGVGAYPVHNDLPVLLAPEMLVPEGQARSVDVGTPRYAEAYEEMEHYNRMGRLAAEGVSSSKEATDLSRLLTLSAEQRAAFPDPPDLWLDAKYELAAQHDAFRHLRPMDGARALQIGGRGLHAVRFLLAGAAEAWVASPMVGELEFAKALARECGVADRLHCVAAIAEELPFADETIDTIYSQGCVHHWVLDAALPECSRVLVAGGRFAAVEPWRGPLYGIGIKILGKRDTNVRCEVLTPGRVQGPLRSLDQVGIAHHGALTRYPLLALWKLGVKPSRRLVWRLGRVDDSISSRIPALHRAGSSVAIMGRRDSVRLQDA